MPNSWNKDKNARAQRKYNRKYLLQFETNCNFVIILCKRLCNCPK